MELSKFFNVITGTSPERKQQVSNYLDNLEALESTSNWIKSCIDSCNDSFQLQCCKTLMELFELQFGESAWQHNKELLQHFLNKESLMIIL